MIGYPNNVRLYFGTEIFVTQDTIVYTVEVRLTQCLPTIYTFNVTFPLALKAL